MATYRHFFNHLAKALGNRAPSEDVLEALAGVVQTEGTNKYHNPFNIEWHSGMSTLWKGIKDYNTVGVQEYSDYAQGFNATVAFLTHNSHWSTVVSRIRHNDGVGVTQALIAAYSWATFHPAGSNAKHILDDHIGTNHPPKKSPAKSKPKDKAPTITKAPKKGHRYKVVKGDTLSEIAAKVYGKASDYPKIAKASNIANPDVIKIGQIVTIP